MKKNAQVTIDGEQQTNLRTEFKFSNIENDIRQSYDKMLTAMNLDDENRFGPEATMTIENCLDNQHEFDKFIIEVNEIAAKWMIKLYDYMFEHMHDPQQVENLE